MITIKIIAASILFSFYFIEQTRMPEKLRLNYKPFNCIICLPFYISTILFFSPIHITNFVLTVFGSCVIAPFIRNFLYNMIQGKIFNNNKT